MLRHVSPLLAAVLLLLPARDLGASDVVYRWTDAAGVLHYSNGGGGVPGEATADPLPSLSTIARAGTAGPLPERRAPARAAVRPSPRAACGLPDESGLADAVARRLEEAGELSRLALFVGNVPVAYGADAVVRVYEPERYPRLWASVEDGVPVAYPAAAPCPTRPPFVRLPVRASEPGGGQKLCADYRRAFAEVGAAVDRNTRVAAPFREIAERYIEIALRGYEATPLGGGEGAPVVAGPDTMAALAQPVPQRALLSPWVTEAHVTQLSELARETRDFVEELTVALEEIDRAARARGCW
jgi:hypothetical protein